MGLAEDAVRFELVSAFVSLFFPVFAQDHGWTPIKMRQIVEFRLDINLVDRLRRTGRKAL